MWLNSEEVRSLGRLLGRKVTGVRIHAQPRKKLYEYERQRDSHRLSVMFSETDPYTMNLKDE